MAKVIAFTRRNTGSSPRAPRDGTSPRASTVINIADRSGRAKVSSVSTAPEILISVVIATHNKPHLLSHCLAGLLRQRFDSSRYEIIVADAASDSCTRDIVADWAMHAKRNGPRITYVSSNGARGLAAARNRGWRAARGSIVAFTCDDTVARADWLQNGWNAFEPDVQAVWGRIVVPYANLSGDYERHPMNLERMEFPAANCFCRKQLLEELGGFDERFTMAWRDDADLYFRLLERSDYVVHAPAVVTTRPIRRAPWGESLRQQRRAQLDALLYKKHPKLYRQKIRRSDQWECYMIVVALLSFAVALAMDQPVVAASAVATWLFLTAWFGAERLPTGRKTFGGVTEAIVASVLVPPLTVFWRLAGALKFRVPFL
jgi:hypothetical protein